MKKAFLLVVILFVSVISTACINNMAVQELNNKAKSYLDNGDYENAISRLKSSVDLDPTIFETHYNLGIAYTQAEKYSEAIETFQSAIKLRPNFADAYYSLAVAQENYAQSIVSGELKNKKEKADNKEDNEEASAKNNKLTDEEKAEVGKLLNDSIASYNTYLQKGKNIEDRKEVEQKINILQNQIIKEGYSVSDITPQ